MPKNDDMGTPNAKTSRGKSLRRYSAPWKPPAWLEKGFLYMFFFVALFATVALFLWSLVTFYIPFQVYSIETKPKNLSNGQTLRVVYPNLILGDNKPVEMILILAGSSNGEQATFTINVPPGLTVRQPKAQEYSTQLELIFSGVGSGIEPEEIKISLVNSRSEHGPGLFVRKHVEITSPQMQDTLAIEIGVETILWMTAQAILNDPANERNALILFVASLLSGAGTLLMQFITRQQDRSRDDWNKRENQFRGDLDKNPVDALDGFSKLKDDGVEESDFSIRKPLAEAFGWEDKLQQIVLERLIKSRDHYFDAKRAADVLDAVCGVFDPKGQVENFHHSRLLAPFCNLVCLDDRKKHSLTVKEAQCLLIVSRRWNKLKPLVTDMLHDFAHLDKNLPAIFKTFGSEQDGQVLRDANIHDIIQIHKDISPYDAVINRINEILIQDIHWREPGPGRERKLSDKVLRWLFACFSEESVDMNFSLGSEYAELEDWSRQSVMELPVFGQIKNPDTMIVFGGEGVGKTASALWLMDQFTRSTKANVFPVYAPYESGVELKDWIMGTIARALINFTADNPRKFITSSESQKTAMGRLMLWNARNLDALRFNLYSSTSKSNNAADVEQVIEYIKKFKPSKASVKMTKDEMLNFLYVAYPTGFEQICFLWDIPASSPHEDVVNKIKEMAGLAVPLTRQNLAIKIFAPLTAKETVGNLGGIRHAGDLTWDDDQLMKLLNIKMKDKFEALWDSSVRSVDDPSRMLIRAVDSSPRRLVRLLLLLMDHVDGGHIQDGETLKKSDFDQMFSGFSGKK